MCPSLWEFGQFFPRTWSGRKDQRLIEHLNKERRKEIEIIKCYIIFLFKFSLHNDNYFDHSKQLSKLLKNLVHTIKVSYFQVMFMLSILNYSRSFLDFFRYYVRISYTYKLATISKAISFIQGGDFNFISEQNWIGEQFNRLQECGFAFSHCSCWLKLCLCSQFIWGLRVAASVFKDGWTVTFKKWDLFAIYMPYIWLR